MFHAVRQLFDQYREDNYSLHPDQAPVVVLGGGDSRHFTAGLDLGDVTLARALHHSSNDAAQRGLALQRLVGGWQQAFTAIEKYPMPVLAAVHGACIGAGIIIL